MSDRRRRHLTVVPDVPEVEQPNPEAEALRKAISASLQRTSGATSLDEVLDGLVQTMLPIIRVKEVEAVHRLANRAMLTLRLTDSQRIFIIWLQKEAMKK